VITFNQVSKRYPTGQEALNQVSFTLQKGEMAFLTGHSGAGKSTLLKLALQLEQPTSGQVLVDNKDLSRLSSRQIPELRRGIGAIFQNPYLLMSRSVFDNVALPLIIANHTREETERRVRAALDKVGLTGKEKMLPVTLSAGEQQRVSIARAIVNKPALLLADEPTGNLDPALAAEIMRLFEEFNQVGVTVLIATHDLTLVATMAYRVLTLKQGQMLLRRDT
jgi:cell division transport system ATP-binding protein